ncbi:hypothetical protein NQD34_009519, partial [Periophthalmus magnuspinnatus]
TNWRNGFWFTQSRGATVKPVRAAVCTHPVIIICYILQPGTLRRLSNEFQEPEGVPGLAVLPVPPHHWHLCTGTMGKIHIQLCPLLCHRHGDLHFLCLCAHPCAAGTGVFLRYIWGSAGEHYGTDELKPKQDMDKR